MNRERAQLAGQLRELMEQLRSEREAREAVERKAKQEVGHHCTYLYLICLCSTVKLLPILCLGLRPFC